MGQYSKIAWTDHTFNPWWGCTPASAGCAHCYAASFAKRTGQDCFGAAPRRFFKDKHWNEPLAWARAARLAGKRARVFCASMADVFEEAPGLDEQRQRLGGLIRETADALDWLLLTKRPENVERMMHPETLKLCWLGVTVEDQRAAEARIPILLKLPARVRFLSCEPLVGPVDFDRRCPENCDGECGHASSYRLLGDDDSSALIDWVIVGGESGGQARPFNLSWARSIVSQCSAAGVACFVKQLGRRPTGWWLSHDEGARRGNVFPGGSASGDSGCWHLTDRDGRDPGEWPEDLRVREFPEARHE